MLLSLSQVEKRPRTTELPLHQAFLINDEVVVSLLVKSK